MGGETDCWGPTVSGQGRGPVLAASERSGQASGAGFSATRCQLAIGLLRYGSAIGLRSKVRRVGGPRLLLHARPTKGGRKLAFSAGS